MGTDLNPGEWTVPAEDPNDSPHRIEITLVTGSIALQLLVAEGVGILTPAEARAYGVKLIEAAAYAEQCRIGDRS